MGSSDASSKTSKDLEGFDVIVEPSTQYEKPPQVKDGGLRAWCTLIGATLTLTCTFGYTNAFGVYQDLYTRSGAASASRISWIGSTQLFLLIAMGLPAGKLLDLGYFRQTTLAGSIIYTFSLFMVSLTHTDKYYQIFLSQGMGMGIGAGMLYVPVMAVQAHHWHVRRPLAMGIVISGSSLGGIFFPIMLDQLFHGSAGYAWGVRASAFIVLALLALANVLMTTDPAVSAYKKAKPDIKGFLHDAPYMLLIAGSLCCLMGVFFPYFYLQLFAILHGINPTFAFYTLAILNGSSIPGRILPNVFANKYGGFNLLIASCVACAALIFGLYGIDAVG
ncbi:MFS general substrate transporter, partial [Dentipellis sp. KUC8613]